MSSPNASPRRSTAHVRIRWRRARRPVGACGAAGRAADRRPCLGQPAVPAFCDRAGSHGRTRLEPGRSTSCCIMSRPYGRESSISTPTTCCEPPRSPRSKLCARASCRVHRVIDGHDADHALGIIDDGNRKKVVFRDQAHRLVQRYDRRRSHHRSCSCESHRNQELGRRVAASVGRFPCPISGARFGMNSRIGSVR